MSIHVSENRNLVYRSPKCVDLARQLADRMGIEVNVVAKGGERIIYRGRDIVLDQEVVALTIDTDNFTLRRVFLDNMDTAFRVREEKREGEVRQG